jgi:hypothetical protein
MKKQLPWSDNMATSEHIIAHMKEILSIDDPVQRFRRALQWIAHDSSVHASNLRDPAACFGTMAQAALYVDEYRAANDDSQKIK